VSKTFPPNTVVEVDLLPGEDGYDSACPLLSWTRGFVFGAMLTGATVADMLGHGWNAFPV
jgi:hypothetical protein